MNFVLHHHLAARDLGSEAAAAGAMLPDVWRMADRRAHLRRDLAGGQAPSAIVDGVLHHVAADARFHASGVFVDGERATRAALRGASAAPKLGLFAHVAWELCLDGALVRRVGLAPLLAGVGASVAAVRPDLHHRAAYECSAAAGFSAPDERARFEAKVDQILDAIARGPWIAGYATGDGIAERLDGVRARLGFEALAARERRAIAAALSALEPLADASIDALLTGSHRRAGQT